MLVCLYSKTTTWILQCKSVTDINWHYYWFNYIYFMVRVVRLHELYIHIYMCISSVNIFTNYDRIENFSSSSRFFELLIIIYDLINNEYDEYMGIIRDVVIWSVYWQVAILTSNVQWNAVNILDFFWRKIIFMNKLCYVNAQKIIIIPNTHR